MPRRRTDGRAARAAGVRGRGRCGRRRGSVISSWLIDLTAAAFAKDAKLDDFEGRVSDSGEGRWTVMAAIEEGVPASIITAALYERFESRGLGDFTDKILSAMRSEFGGHAEKKD